MRNRLAITVLCLVGLSGCATITMNESDMIPAFGVGQVDSTVPEGFSVEEHHFTRPDGTSVYGRSIVSDPTAPTLLYYGGNHQSVDGSIHRLAEVFPRMGLNLYYFDRRGQGRNPGTPTVATSAKDAGLVYEYVREQAKGHLIVLGLSLGGFEATSIAREYPVEALVLVATATNIDDFLRTAIPWYMKPFIRAEVADELRGIDNAENIAEYHGPLLLVAGEDDRQTSPRLMEWLYETSSSEHRQLVIIDDARHNNVLMKDQAQRAYRTFLEQAGLLPSAEPADQAAP